MKETGRHTPPQIRRNLRKVDPWRKLSLLLALDLMFDICK